MTVRCTDSFVKPHPQVSQRLITIYMHGPSSPAERSPLLTYRTAAMRAGAVRERRLRNVITEGLGVVLDRRRSVTAGTRGALPW